MTEYIDYYKAPFGILYLKVQNEVLTELNILYKYPSFEDKEQVLFQTMDIKKEELDTLFQQKMKADLKKSRSIETHIVQEEKQAHVTAKQQLDEYFLGKRKKFDLPLKPCGTQFQLCVWEGLLKIPYGETRSYKQMAESIDRPKAQRAVGGANNKNPIMIVVPCHRVLGANGALVGFGGGLDVKKYLLDLEKQN